MVVIKFTVVNCFFLLTLLYHFIEFTDTFSILKKLNIRVKRETTADCPKWKFICGDGKTCIQRKSRCDGKIDCPDQSDESTNCRHISCPQNTFRCSYGACVPRKARCNKKRDCADDSDEQGCGYQRHSPANDTSLAGISGCRISQFTCKDGECISRFDTCDGVEHCGDGSDETKQVCEYEICSPNSFQCAYGACLSAEVKCDGKKDCPDNSDEDAALCDSKNQTITRYIPTSVSDTNSCKIPARPGNGTLKVVGWESEAIEGKFINSGGSLQLICNSNYVLSSQSREYIPCENGKWKTSFPTCIRTCPSRKSFAVDFECSLNGTTVRCDDPIKEGTEIKMACKEHYQLIKHTSGFNPSTATCKDGSWDYDIMRCEAKCGALLPTYKPYVVQGQDASIEIHPWHVGIYRLLDNKFKHICGGTLINIFTVVSAAHCFTDMQDNKLQKKESFLIAAGKNYRDLDDSRDKETIQKRKVREIIVHRNYRGHILSYIADIALIRVDQHFELTNTVALACIDWNSNYKLPKESIATVVGWGVTQIGGDLGDPVLKKLTVPFLTKEECYSKVPKDFEKSITVDKYCAGYFNGSSVCTGDSGGGLITRDTQNFHTLRGIVSGAPAKDNSCDNDQIALYTKISSYIDFIQQSDKFLLN